MALDTSNVSIRLADLEDPYDAQTVLALLNEYAKHPMGQEDDLPESVQAKLIDGLRNHPTTLVFLAEQSNQGSAETSPRPVGIASCFVGFSTFKAAPLINVHDLYVTAEVRGTGLGGKLLDAVADHARQLDYCAVTLEVRSDNPARKLYEKKEFDGIRPQTENGTEYQMLFGKRSLDAELTNHDGRAAN